MAELKTKKTKQSVAAFLNAIPDEQVRRDSKAIAAMMQRATKARPRMWGPAIIGFGDRRYKYPDGREMDWMELAFSPRKQNITLYTMGFEGQDKLLQRLGTHSCGKGCLYIKRLADIDVPTLNQIITAALKSVRAQDRRSRR